MNSSKPTQSKSTPNPIDWVVVWSGRSSLRSIEDWQQSAAQERYAGKLLHRRRRKSPRREPILALAHKLVGGRL